MPSTALAKAASEAFTARTTTTTTTATTAPNPRHTPDPFWNATPRSGTANITALLKAVQKIVPAPSATTTTTAMNPTPPRPSRYATRHANCTHMSVVRVRGDLTCFMCFRVPHFGWVYRCRQDHVPSPHSTLPNIDRMPVVSGHDDDFDAKARVAEYLDMSSSIVDGIRKGHYDMHQVETLIQQRENVIHAINEHEAPSSDSQSSSVRSSFSDQTIIASVGANAHSSVARNIRPAASLPMTPAGTPANTPHESKVTTPTKPDSVMAQPLQPKCDYQACPNCRLHFQDRLWTSFESVWNGEHAPITKEEMRGLHMIDPRLARTIGLRPSPTPVRHRPRSLQSIDIARYDGEDGSTEISVDWTHSTVNGEDDSNSDRLNTSELFPCPGPLQCPVWSRHSGCAYDAGFDDGRRAENHGYATSLTPEHSRSHLRHLASLVTSTPCDTSSIATASSISLPTPQTAPLTPVLHEDDAFEIAMQKPPRRSGKARSVCCALSGERHRISLRSRESHSSIGSEVEVAGGVALTEEAVESRIPDIVDE